MEPEEKAKLSRRKSVQPNLNLFKE